MIQIFIQIKIRFVKAERIFLFKTIQNKRIFYYFSKIKPLNYVI